MKDSEHRPGHCHAPASPAPACHAGSADTKPCHATEQHGASCHGEGGAQATDWLLWGSLAAIVPLYVLQWWFADDVSGLPVLGEMSASVFEILNVMAWGLVAAIVFVGLLGHVPKEFVTSMLGRGGTAGGVFRATAAGVLLDLCSHGILAVGMRLYERGASIGQVMAFLLASPWNSFSLTLILWALIGLPWTLAFIALSMVVALVTGILFDVLVHRGTLPANPNRTELPEDFRFLPEARERLRGFRPDRPFLVETLREGLRGSRMVLRWIFFGILLAALVRTFIEAHHFQAWFGATVSGLLFTIAAATVIEVCSEGSVPIAGDLFSRAGAPGNAFAFLMSGVATDYTEVMSIQNTTRSWKIALFLPLLAVPQVILVALVINGFT